MQKTKIAEALLTLGVSSSPFVSFLPVSSYRIILSESHALYHIRITIWLTRYSTQEANSALSQYIPSNYFSSYESYAVCFIYLYYNGLLIYSLSGNSTQAEPCSAVARAWWSMFHGIRVVPMGFVCVMYYYICKGLSYLVSQML